MLRLKQEFMDHMDRVGVRYDDRDATTVTVTYSGDNMQSIRISVIFDEDGDNYVSFINWGIGKYEGDRYPRALLTCNAMNAKWRWVKFYIDGEKDVAAKSDAIVSPGTAGEECLEVVRRMVNIIDESYLEFLRIKLG